MKKELLIVLTILVITSLACSFTVNLPSIETGPDKTFEVNEDLPSDGNSAQVRLEVGAASLSIKPNADALVEGSIVYNVTGWEPMVSRTDDSIVIKQETKGIQGIPSSSIKNDWDLRFNNDVPMDLTINAGAYQGKVELGGLSLTSLRVDDGASDSTVKFSEPNQVRMDVLDYNTGASNITLEGLANANFKQMSFSGGAGNYTLDFSGELQNDSQVEVEAGVSTIKIIIPEGMNAEVHVNGEMKGVNTRGTWTVDGSNYSTEGSGPTLLIDVNMNLGSLDLVQE
jgi:hypothetical protein